jgi:predicted nuclease with RNAse H fold
MNERRSSKNSNDPATKIERTLDNQLNALRDINARAAEVERMLESMGMPVR